jgi:hypothetical protein
MERKKAEILADIATRMCLNFEEAVYLPAAVKSAACKVNLSEDDMIHVIRTNMEMLNYIASGIKKAAKMA